MSVQPRGKRSLQESSRPRTSIPLRRRSLDRKAIQGEWGLVLSSAAS